MKRVIEINENATNMYDLVGSVMNSISLNEVLDKIIEEIRHRMNMYKASDFKPNRMKAYALSDVIDIINKYKESEE